MTTNYDWLLRPRPPAEATVFQPGDRDPVVALEGSAAAVADIGRRPTRSGRGPGGRHVPGEHGRDPLRLRREAAKLGTYAVRHRMLTALANFGGPSGGLRSGGRRATGPERWWPRVSPVARRRAEGDRNGPGDEDRHSAVFSAHSPGGSACGPRGGRVQRGPVPLGPFVDPRDAAGVLPREKSLGVGTVSFTTFGVGKMVGETSGYNQPLKARPPRMVSSGGAGDSAAAVDRGVPARHADARPNGDPAGAEPHQRAGRRVRRGPVVPAARLGRDVRHPSPGGRGPPDTKIFNHRGTKA
ncbi:Aldo/keto reductase OS=Corallococcus coralloides (strain ATCC 25202 / DSM 2259 / NBRC 100086 / M2) GN=yajO1 PE=4 SV=1 [Gemmataceae bacterium]|nr:Aldo/keto reductase OS=Corallococcus coralloides (strain ATCC 25202 / DSM 2259 / NBRC 100086 / M2) GN=yajO1 PE=4 SV=1 [Gemmataceae bacterium]VTT99610.1 Aldo/keto reductase OS=Corallococcus coralloides (strain ATCC 25202 / DSM 2259 / NBRC 100086 / M2) GN=yajO1 PE=4 SV=1 [Gemmataceae bacterium]